MSKNSSITDKEIIRATHLSLVEILFGSVMHGFKIPMTGQLLSLYQLNVLANSLNKDSLPRSSAVEISGIVAVLKSLSPAGQKLGPMISILFQGMLFWFGTLILGVNLFGQILGAALLSMWSFIQPFITYFLIYGFDLLRMFEHYQNKANRDYPYAERYLILFLAGLITVKTILACLIVSFSYFKKTEWSLQTTQLENFFPPQSRQSASQLSIAKAALKDILNPLFLLSFVLMVIFLWQIETNLSRLVWLSLRPLAIAYLIFYFIRSPLTHSILIRWAKRSVIFQRFYDKALLVLKTIEQKRQA